MLQSYEAIYESGAMKWLADKPQVKYAHVIVTILAEKEVTIVSPQYPSPVIAGKGKILGDLTMPVVSENEWNCLT